METHSPPTNPDRPDFNFEEIREAQQDEALRAPTPGSQDHFPIKNFMDYKWIEKGIFSDSKFNLVTFLYPTSLDIPKGVVILFHGLNSHCNRNAHLARKLAEAGYDVAAFDQLGCGPS